MSIIEIIKERKSVRSYTGELLSTERLEKVSNYIKQRSAPFGAKARIDLVSSDTGEQPVKLGTYGVISGANHFLALIIEKDHPLAEISGGYIFEQAILYCTDLDLGTCWLGGTFNSKEFLRQLQLEENEKLTIISPVGYKREKKRLLDSMMRAGAGSDHRKAFETLFFKNTFKISLSKEEAKEYVVPLEMVRLAPSASNKQPWRILKENTMFHFYHQPNSFSLNDIGIALCHFELTCKELNLKGSFQRVKDAPSTNGLKYAMSWCAE